jgi:large subunit ribosomal protein L19
MSSLIGAFASEPKTSLPRLQPGDTVRVHNRIVEGDRERVQVFQGVLMRMKGKDFNARVTVRRIAAHGVGVERTFLLASPRLEKVEVVRRAHVRRKQLYYLRQRRGKAARLRSRPYVRPEPAKVEQDQESTDQA